MREILLNGTYYKLAPKSDILKKTVNPWKAAIKQTGTLEYSDFSNAEFEEYHDFRNGVGQNRGVGSDARTQWTEGIDFTIDGQTVLGPLVITAGAFGVAPVKIIDFQSGTYAIGNSLISKWNTTTEVWDSVCTYLTSPIDAVVVTDATDEYLVVSSATEAFYTVDGATWVRLYGIASATGTGWDNLSNAYDESTTTKTTSPDIPIDGTCAWVVFTLTNPIPTTTIKVWPTRENTTITTMRIEAYYDSGYTEIYSDTPTYGAWNTITMGLQTVTNIKINFSQVGGSVPLEAYINEVQVIPNTLGYMADYEQKLYFISTDGTKVKYSASENIDAYSGTFALTGSFGTVYDLFEGKLLADGTPTLYFTSTSGLYTVDTTNELAYKQEVSYPPLTYAGHRGMYWNANVWVATGYGILKVSSSLATPIGTDLDDGLPSGYQGYVYDMFPVNNWLVFCVNGGTTDKSSIFKRNSSYGGNLQVYTTSAINNPIACIWHSPSSLYTNGRLWFGEGTNIKYMMFPDTTSNAKQIATYEYVDNSGYGKLPIFRKIATISKTALGVAAITKSCSDALYIEVFYGLNGAAPTTSLGTFITSPKPSILLFNSGLGIEFYTIQIAIKIYRG